MAKNKPRLVQHPWSRWFSRRGFRLVRGRQFNCMPHSMSVQVRRAAAARRLRVSVTIREDILTVVVMGRTVRHRRKGRTPRA